MLPCVTSVRLLGWTAAAIVVAVLTLACDDYPDTATPMSPTSAARTAADGPSTLSVVPPALSPGSTIPIYRDGVQWFIAKGSSLLPVSVTATVGRDVPWAQLNRLSLRNEWPRAGLLRPEPSRHAGVGRSRERATDRRHDHRLPVRPAVVRRQCHPCVPAHAEQRSAHPARGGGDVGRRADFRDLFLPFERLTRRRVCGVAAA